MSLRPLMVLGCTSDSGKSLLVTGLARWFRRRGVDVVPFKAQNMSNNARVVAGGEIGVAQWLQARAAELEPTVDMNPVLLKPEADTRSQVVASGRVRHDITATPWRERGPLLWPEIESACRRLQSSHDLVLIEGAGSPAEINLEDMVNNRVLEFADAAALLVSDIDRGGSFAHLYGTWSLVPTSTRDRLAGFILNKFRGDAGLLAPGPEELAGMTGMQPVGVMPMLDHDLPDEEGASIHGTPPAGSPVVAVVRAPFASNLDEFHVLSWAAEMRWATSPRDLAGADLVIIPGSKHVAADARWLRERRLDGAIKEHVGRGGRTLGICGGAMLLGGTVSDSEGVEGATEGLGVLPLTTQMEPDKVTSPATVAFSGLDEPWSALNGISAGGYEIRNGRISGDGCLVSRHVWSSGPVLATSVHGLLEDPSVLQALTGNRPDPILEHTFDVLADAVATHLDTTLIADLVGVGS